MNIYLYIHEYIVYGLWPIGRHERAELAGGWRTNWMKVDPRYSIRYALHIRFAYTSIQANTRLCVHISLSIFICICMYIYYIYTYCTYVYVHKHEMVSQQMIDSNQMKSSPLNCVMPVFKQSASYCTYATPYVLAQVPGPLARVPGPTGPDPGPTGPGPTGPGPGMGPGPGSRNPVW